MNIADLAERDWDRQLFETKRGLARSLGWNLCYHTLRSKGSVPGFPDRVLIRDRVIFAELKTEAKSSKPSDKQIEYLDGLAAAGAEVYLWRPRDLDEIGRILSQRWSFATHCEPAFLASPSDGWTPGSLWIAGQGRYDQRPDLEQRAIA